MFCYNISYKFSLQLYLPKLQIFCYILIGLFLMILLLLKLCLQRCSAGCKVFLEGDYQAQVDDVMFSGDNNGLKRVIQAFDGDPMFGHVDLPNVWRSRIAELAEKL